MTLRELSALYDIKEILESIKDYCAKRTAALMDGRLAKIMIRDFLIHLPICTYQGT